MYIATSNFSSKCGIDLSCCDDGWLGNCLGLAGTFPPCNGPPCSKEKQNVSTASRNAVKGGVDIFRLQVYSEVLSNRAEQLELLRRDDFYGGIPLRSAWGSSLTHQKHKDDISFCMKDARPMASFTALHHVHARKLRSDFKIVVPWIDSLVFLSFLSPQHTATFWGRWGNQEDVRIR